MDANVKRAMFSLKSLANRPARRTIPSVCRRHDPNYQVEDDEDSMSEGEDSAGGAPGSDAEIDEEVGYEILVVNE